MAVRVLAALPTTPVGKLFKPALRHLEVADVVRGEARALGLALDDVEVAATADGGFSCRILPPARAALADRLSEYGLSTATTGDTCASPL